jgi:hypothetical protein
MADQTQKPQGTFAKLMSSSPPQQEQKPRLPANQHASKPANWHAGEVANQQTGKTNLQDHKVSTEKVTYRFHAEGKYAVEDMKTILARKHGIKASLEEIAEACILLAYEDLLENRHARASENKKSS